MFASIIISTVIILTLLIIIIFLLKKPLVNFLNLLIEKIINTSIEKVEGKSRDILKNERDNLVESAKKELDYKKDSISNLIGEMRKDLNKAQNKIEQEDQKRISEFTSLKTIVEQHKTITESLGITVNDLKRLLSNNQLRGSFGQEIAEDLLKMAGFVIGQNYTKQSQQNTSKSIPDFVIFLPDETKVNVDVKFPFQALQKARETNDKGLQDQYIDNFKLDIKKKIKEVTTRDYINPEENTVDFVILFIPNEMIFSFVYEKFNDVWKEAIEKNVIMCGPFSFTAILRMVKQAYNNFKYQKNIHHIINHVKEFENEYKNFSDAIDTLGNRIQSASKQYEEVSGARNNKLTRIINKIKSEEIPLAKSSSILILDDKEGQK